ncbi:MAG: AzlD domain-containing protein [Clostridia bacterium]|nr:AzlD domain-containing protein [Clostridia bacterium]
MNEIHAWLMVAVIALVTAGLRFLPFLIFSGGRKTPAIIERLGAVLPAAMMAMLVVYCLKGTSFATAEGWVPVLIGVAVTAGLHVWKRNTLLSIVGGTVCYMLLVQVVF